MSLDDDIAIITRQEAELVFPSFNEDDAHRLGCLLREQAVARGKPVAIEIRTPARALFVTTTPGSAPDNADWIRRKSNTVLRLHRSSYGFGRSLAQSGTTISAERGLDAMDYAAHGGAFPITVKGTGVIGVVTVSGLPQREDHRLVVRGICLFLGRDPAGYDLP